MSFWQDRGAVETDFSSSYPVFAASKGREVLILDAMARKGSHTSFRSFAKRKGASKRRGRKICLLGGKRCAVGRDTWLAGLSFLILLTHSAIFEEDAYWLESYCLLIFWGKFGRGTSAGLHFCFCFPPMYHMRLSSSGQLPPHLMAVAAAACYWQLQYRNET